MPRPATLQLQYFLSRPEIEPVNSISSPFYIDAKEIYIYMLLKIKRLNYGI